MIVKEKAMEDVVHQTGAPIIASGVAVREGAGECRALAQIIDRIGDKWTVMVVGHLSQGSLRFSELMRAIPGISHRMLTLTLRGLQRDGLVSRTAFATVPPRVDYALTELGLSLTGPLTILAGWASQNKLEVEKARADYDSALGGN